MQPDPTTQASTTASLDGTATSSALFSRPCTVSSGRRPEKTRAAGEKPPTAMAKKTPGPSQLMELYLTVAAELGFVSDRDVGALADVGQENVANWRSGAVREFKNQKFRAAVDNLTAQLRTLRSQAGRLEPASMGSLSPP